MFYDKFVFLCKEKGVAPTRAALDIGLSKSAPIKWRTTGATPNGETLNKIAEYFSVSVSVLLGEETKKAPTPEGERDHAIDHIDDELKEYLDELRSRSEMRMLFSTTKNATKTQIEAIVKMIEEMQGEK